MNFVNAYQSQEDRRLKYRTCRDAGLSVSIATRLRDLTWPHYAMFLDSYVQIERERDCASCLPVCSDA